MAGKRLKADPDSIDLILAAFFLARQRKGYHAGYYALNALSLLFILNLPGEEGSITPTNFQRRLDRLRRDADFPPEMSQSLLKAWRECRPDLERKVSVLSPHRMRKVKNFVELVVDVFETCAGIPLSEVVAQMTVTDVARLEAGFGLNLAAAKRRSLPFPGFQPEDFESIFLLQRRLEDAARRLVRGLPDRRGLLSGPGGTSVDYTSCWTAVSLFGNPLNSPGEEVGFQILATPWLVAAGLVFGPQASQSRRRYYEILEDDRGRKLLRELEGAGAELVDFYWYCYQESRTKPSKLKPEELSRLAQKARAELGSPPFTSGRLIPQRTWSYEEALVRGGGILDDCKLLYLPVAELVRSLSAQ